MQRKPAPRHIALAVAAALMPWATASAQQATTTDQPAPAAASATTPADSTDALSLDRVTVTGTSAAGTKMRQSVSISTLDSTEISRSAPTSAAEILRAVPGVRSESSGGEGNANLTVRGVPISAGGARYVQFQEDGLPVVLFGDIAFGTADQFIRADYNLDVLEVIRGGSASTTASNSPGGIINFISKTGQEPGGAVGFSHGLGYDESRYDFDYGGRVAARTRFHLGGFYRYGEGPRPVDFNTERGGQIKGNVTQELENGFVRVSFKSLDDRTPTFLPVPVKTVNGSIGEIDGIDPRKAFFLSPNLSRDVTLDRNNNTVTSNTADGLRVNNQAIGVEGLFAVGQGWTVQEKFRKSDITGRFMGLFPSISGDSAQALAQTYKGTKLVYATGPNAGLDVAANAQAFTGVLFNTSIDSLGSTVNDLKLSKDLAAGDGKIKLVGGLFQSIQDVALTWYWNTYLIESKGENPALLNVYNGATRVTPSPFNNAPGVVASGLETFGGCCARSFDVQYTTTAPYAAVTWEQGPFNVDGSVRYDKQKAAGWTVQGNTTAGKFDSTTQRIVSYDVDHTSYSVGGNYSLTRDFALFARVSDGVSFNADRLLYGQDLSGKLAIPTNEVKQFEAGAKLRAGGFSMFATLFNARTKESNFEATTQTFTDRKYTANGLELELGYRLGDFRITGGGTFTKAKITAAEDPTIVDKKPRRQADFVYQLTPSYNLGDFDIGGSIIGTTKSWGDDGNTITLPAYTVFNLFANYQLTPSFQISLAANNAFNKIGYTEVEGDGHAARSINGRTIKAGLKYAF